MSNSISKSQFLKGIQCTKALWYYRNRKDLEKEVNDAQQAIFDRGTEIGKLAHQYFKGGIEVEADYWDVQQAVSITEDLVEKGQKVIFEATAESDDGLYSKIDVFRKVKGKDEWDMIEVKGIYLLVCNSIMSKKKYYSTTLTTLAHTSGRLTNFHL